MDKEIVDRALDALDRLMRMFRLERFVYMICAIVSFLLLIYAAYIMFETKGVSVAELGLIFGATGLTTVSAGRITYFLNKSFNLIEAIVRKLSGLEEK